jgi:hypothetical protein
MFVAAETQCHKPILRDLTALVLRQMQHFKT